MSKVVVIGGGASGMIASIKASLNNEVILLEGNNSLGKKILVTGNGRCNYWNSDIDIKNYHTDDINNLENILSNKDEVLGFLDSLGIYPKIKNGYYYPNSNMASSVDEILIKKIENSNIDVITECKVTSIEKVNDKFIITSNLHEIICDKVIIATGSRAYPKTGSDGSSYTLLEKYHTINKVLPSLVPLIGKGNFKDWENIRIDAKATLYINNELIDSEIGEVQLTDYGVSGIPIFNLSGLASKNLDKNVSIKLNFLPEIDNILEFLESRNNKVKANTIEELLESVLPYKLVFMLLKKSNINKDDNYNDINQNKKEYFSNLISNFNVEITDTLDFDRSQVCTGGISLTEINPDTMESTKVKDLYLVGELLDVDGKCGGFNLGFAFISGYIAGKSV